MSTATTAVEKKVTIRDHIAQQFKEQIEGIPSGSCAPAVTKTKKYRDANPIGKAVLASVSQVVDTTPKKTKRS